jgi:hypothetical protein
MEVVATDTYWIHGIGIPWSSVEPVKDGGYNWAAIANIEQEIRTASSYAFSPIVTIYSTPGWAQEDPPYNKTCGRIKPSEYGSFANFMSAVVQRYSQPPYNVKYWKIWNEPDVDPSFSVSPWLGCWGDDNDTYYGGGVYGDMLDAIYTPIKTADSEAQVMVGGLLLDCNPNDLTPLCYTKPGLFLQGILENGSGGSFDGVGFHSYDFYHNALGRYGNLNWEVGWDNSGPVIIAKSNYLKSLLEDPKYGLSAKFLMNLESAIRCDPTWPAEPPFDCGILFEVTKAYYIVQAYTVSIAQGLLSNVWYSVLGWPSNNTGLLDGSLNPLPAYNSYKFTASILGTSTLVRVIPQNPDLQGKPVYGYELDRGDRYVWVLWAYNDGSHSITLPDMPDAIYQISSSGEPISLTPTTTLNVTKAPIFIEWP